jgi:hypothetical protein
MIARSNAEQAMISMSYIRTLRDLRVFVVKIIWIIWLRRSRAAALNVESGTLNQS